MKLRSTIAAALMLVAASASCQVALLDKVYDFIGARDLARAESAILQAEKHVTTANDARTFYLKAYVYKEMFSNASGAERKKLRLKVFESVKRCEALDVDHAFKPVVRQLHDYMIASVFNDASDAFNKQDYHEAIEGFRQYLDISVINDEYWLDANYFLASSLNGVGETDSAVVYYELLKDRNYDQPLVFVDLAYIHLKKGNLTPAKQVIQEGVRRFPTYYDILVAELNVLSASRDFRQLEARAEQFLKENPESIDVMLMLAGTYMKDVTQETRYAAFQKAVAVYQSVIAADPLNYDGNYNLGVLYYNEAVDIVNQNNFDTDIDQLTIILEKSTTFFQSALPLLLKIYDLKQNDLKLLSALQAIYYNLNMKPELAEVNGRIKSLEAK